MNAHIFNTLRRVQAETDDIKRAELMASTKEELGSHFSTHKADADELAFSLFNQAFTDVQPGDLAARLVDVKNVGLGEVDYIDEDLYGMRAYFQGKGGQIHSDILRYGRTQMPREEMVAAIDMHVDELLLDFWGTLTKLQAQAREKIRTLPTEAVIALVRASVTAGITYGTFAAATLTSAQVDPIIREVKRASKGGVSIVGTEIAVELFSNIGLNYGDNVKEQLFRSGVIGSYKTTPVVQLENWEDFEGDYVLKDDELYIVGRNAGRVTFYGSSPKAQTLELPSFMRRWETARDVGISLYGAAKGRVGRIVLT